MIQVVRRREFYLLGSCWLSALVIYVRVLMCVLKEIWEVLDKVSWHLTSYTTPLKLILHFPLNNPYNVFAKVRGTGFSNYIPVCYGSPSLLRYKDTSLVRTPFLSLTTTLKVCILIPQLSKKLTVFHPVGLYIRGVPFVITVIMINSVIPSYYTHLSILTFILRSHTHTHLYWACGWDRWVWAR